MSETTYKIFIPAVCWKLIFEFYNTAAIRCEMKRIAIECKKVWMKHAKYDNGESKYNEVYSFSPLWQVECRSKAFSLHYLNKKHLDWNYEYMTRTNYYDNIYINIFNSPHSGTLDAGLKLIEWRKLLSQNGVKKCYQMNYKELISIYLKL